MVRSDFEWSTANDFILSTSLDQTIRLWDTKNGKCVRTIQENSEVLSCSFCPTNNNLFVVGTMDTRRPWGLKRSM